MFDGHGSLAGTGKLKVEKDGKPVANLTAKNIILATGARARSPAGAGTGRASWSGPTRKPWCRRRCRSRCWWSVSGAIGIEFASFYRDLGAEVTVVEVVDRVLPVEDEEISLFARKAFEKQGMKIMTGATVKALKKGAGNVTATIDAGGKTSEITVDRVILAVGIVGNVEKLGLEGTKVKVEKAHVVTDPWGFTGEPGVYAIGDLVGPPWLAHKASHEGVICVEKIAGLKGLHPLNIQNIPGCTYCRPQVASVGMTEKAAKAVGREVKVGRFPLHRQRQGDRPRRA